jgi:hypothetical protein
MKIDQELSDFFYDILMIKEWHDIILAAHGGWWGGCCCSFLFSCHPWSIYPSVERRNVSVYNIYISRHSYFYFVRLLNWMLCQMALPPAHFLLHVRLLSILAGPTEPTKLFWILLHWYLLSSPTPYVIIDGLSRH